MVEKVEKKADFELTEISVQTATVIKNNITNEVINESQALILILNELAEIKARLKKVA